MGIKFKEFILAEYRKAPLGNLYSKTALRNFLDDEENLVQLKTHTVIPNEKDIVIFEYSFNAIDKVFILTDRQDKDDIVGYMFIHQILPNYWQARDVTIFPPYQNKGLGVDLYVKVIQSKFNLINGYSQSKQAEAIWKKLRSLVNMQVINIQTKRIENYSNKPELDDAEDEDQQWFYLATSNRVLPEALNENTGSGIGEDKTRYGRWLQADPTYKLHGFCSSKYGEDGDF